MMQPRSSERAWIYAFFIQLALFLIMAPANWQCEGVDEIEYLALADSLRQGLGYTLYGEPYGYYPPLYPLFLAGPGHWFGPLQWKWMHGLNILCGLLGLHLGAWILRRTLGPAGKWASVLLLTSYFGWSFSSRYLMSEPLYLLLSMGAAAATLRLQNAIGRAWKWLLLVLILILLSAMSRSAAITLTAAVGFSIFLSGMVPRRRNPGRRIAAAVCVAVVGLGFFTAWEIRGLRIHPDSPESYLRWAASFMGLETEDTGITAENRGEGIRPEENSLTHRSLILSTKLGQYVLSLPRVPPSFLPLGLFICLCVGAGLVEVGRTQPDHPMIWITVTGLGIAALTSWVSSYHRYLYVLSPFLFGAATIGFLEIRDRIQKSVPWRTLVSTLFAGAFLWTVVAAGHSAPEDTGTILRLLHLGCLLAYIAGAGLPWIPALRHLSKSSLIWVARSFVLLLAAGSLSLMALRVRLTRANETLHYRNLAGVLNCAEWIRTHTEEGVVVHSTYPLLIQYPAQRKTLRPAPPERGLTHPGELGLTLGILTAVPAMPWDAEKLFSGKIGEQYRGGEVTCLYQHGDAAVWRRNPPTTAPVPNSQ